MARRTKFLRAVWNAALYYMRENRKERLAADSGSEIPATAMLDESGLPMLTEDGSYMLMES